MKKTIFYTFFLIILPISFESSDYSGCNYSDNKTDNTERAEKSNHSNPYGNTDNKINSEQ